MRVVSGLHTVVRFLVLSIILIDRIDLGKLLMQFADINWSTWSTHLAFVICALGFPRHLKQVKGT